MTKSRHAASLLFVWRIAELEARHLHADHIEPIHLFIGLCKVVDVDLPELISKDVPDRDAILEELLREVRRVKTVFRSAGVDPRKVRRLLRKRFEGSHDVLLPKGQLHRTQASKDIFSDGEHLAEMTNSPVYPVHLLYALVSAKDIDRETVLSELKVDMKHLCEAARQNVLDVPERGLNDHTLN